MAKKESSITNFNEHLTEGTVQEDLRKELNLKLKQKPFL